jgi:hypothetical protein
MIQVVDCIMLIIPPPQCLDPTNCVYVSLFYVIDTGSTGSRGESNLRTQTKCPRSRITHLSVKLGD